MCRRLAKWRLGCGVFAVVVSVVLTTAVGRTQPAHAEPDPSGSSSASDGGSGNESGVADKPAGASRSADAPNSGPSRTPGGAQRPIDAARDTAVAPVVPPVVPPIAVTTGAPLPPLPPLPSVPTPSATPTTTDTFPPSTTPTTTGTPVPPSTTPTDPLTQLVRITVGVVVYLVTLPVRVAAAVFVLADRIYHYVVDRHAVRITGYQNRGAKHAGVIYPGLPRDVTVQNVGPLN
jgi:hypothetical protein